MEKDKRRYYSGSYHRYFQNYSERREVDQNGKMHITRVYIGKYYCPDLTEKGLLWRKAAYIGLYLLSLILFIWSNTRPLVCMLSRPVGICQCLSLLSLLWLLLGVIAFVIQPKKLEEKHFRDSVVNLKRACILSAGCLLATAAAVAWFLYCFKGYEREESLICLAMYMVAAGIVIAIYWIENRVQYLILPEKNERPPKSSVIQY